MPDRPSLDVVSEVLGKTPARHFAQSIEMSVNLKDLDLSVPKNRLEDEVQLPNGRGKAVKVGVFGSPELCQKMRGVADLVVAANELDDWAKDKKAAKKQVNHIDFFLAEAPLMPTIGKRLGVLLGPRGKMPRPVPPGSDPTNLVHALKRSIRIRSKGNRTFHAPVGTQQMKPEELAQNVDAVLNRIVGRLERGRTNIESVYLKTTMGPAIRLW
ncbi:MAG TPA: 50S ribosomal protein L1 [Thermoplasmata archaeon]|nr:50S ribosomal protein L1 [Thermoplasmata archaeon]